MVASLMIQQMTLQILSETLFANLSQQQVHIWYFLLEIACPEMKWL